MDNDMMPRKNPLQPLLDDPTVRIIFVDGPRRIYVRRAGEQPEHAEHVEDVDDSVCHFEDDEHIIHTIRELLLPLGQHIDDTAPIVETVLKDGSHISAILPPIALNGPVLTLNKAAQSPLSIEDITDRGGWSEEMVALLREAVAGRLNIIVSGGLASGKTTLLRAIATMIPAQERIILVKHLFDLPHTRAITLAPRPPDAHGRGEVTPHDLITSALRLDCDRLIVNDVEGQEARILLNAIATKGRGSLASLSAASPQEALKHLELQMVSADPTLSNHHARHVIASTLDLIVQAERLPDGTRVVTHITEVQGLDRDVIRLADIFFFVRDLTNDGSGTQEQGLRSSQTSQGGLQGSFVASHHIDSLRVRLQHDA